MISRRALISMLPPAAGLALLSGCEYFAPIVKAAPQIAQDAGLIADAVQAILPTIEALTGLAGGAKNTIVGVVAGIKSVSSQIAGASSGTATGLVQQLVGGVASLASLLGGVAVPGWVGTVLTAATALLPTIEAAVGIVTAPPTHRFAGAAMTPDQARAILALAAAK